MELSTTFLTEIVFIFAAFIIGSIPNGYLLGMLFRKIDVREHGSGNVGATNVFRVLGWKLGLSALVLDILKGLIVVTATRSYFPENTYLILGCGILAILGHIFSIFLKFKGGKGVATSAGVFIALTPWASAIALVGFILTLLLTKYVSAGSIIASIALVTAQLIIYLNRAVAVEYLIISIVVAAFIIIKHVSNIKRIINGTENRLSFKRKKD